MSYDLTTLNFGNLLSTTYTGAGCSPLNYLFSGLSGTSAYNSIFNAYNTTSSTTTDYKAFIGYGIAGVLTTVLGSLGLGAIQRNSARKASERADIETQENNIKSLTSEISTAEKDLGSQLAILGITDKVAYNNQFKAKITGVDPANAAGVKTAQDNFNTADNALKKQDNAIEAAKLKYEQTKDPADLQAWQAAKDARLELETKQKEAEEKLGDAKTKKSEMEAAQKEALRLFDEIKEKQAELKNLKAAKAERDLEDADGNAMKRFFSAKHYTVDGDKYSSAGKLTEGDLMNLLNEYKNGNSTRREAIKKFIVEQNKASNIDKIESSTIRNYLKENFKINL